MPRLVNIKNKQTSLNYNRYIVGSGVGSKSRSVQKALMRRASNNAQGEPCCFNNTPSNPISIILDASLGCPIPASTNTLPEHIFLMIYGHPYEPSK